MIGRILLVAISVLEGAALTVAASAHLSNPGLPGAALVEAVSALALVAGAVCLAVPWRRDWQGAALGQTTGLMGALALIVVRAVAPEPFTGSADLRHVLLLLALLAGFLVTCRNLRLPKNRQSVDRAATRVAIPSAFVPLSQP